MKPIRSGLLAFAAAVFACGVQAQTIPTTQLAQSEPRDFTPDRWNHFTAAFEAMAGVHGETNADDLLLVTCRERDRRMSLSFHPADQSGLSENANLTLVFDGGAPADVEIRAINAISKRIIFLMIDTDPDFQPMIDKFLSSKTVEMVILQAGTAPNRHRFTLAGAAEAIAPGLKLCGH